MPWFSHFLSSTNPLIKLKPIKYKNQSRMTITNEAVDMIKMNQFVKENYIPKS